VPPTLNTSTRLTLPQVAGLAALLALEQRECAAPSGHDSDVLLAIHLDVIGPAMTALCARRSTHSFSPVSAR